MALYASLAMAAALAGSIVISMGGASRADEDGAFGLMTACGATVLVIALMLAFAAGRSSL